MVIFCLVNIRRIFLSLVKLVLLIGLLLLVRVVRQHRHRHLMDPVFIVALAPEAHLFFFDLFSDPLSKHEIVLLLVTLGKERDLFPDFNVLAGTFRMVFSVVSHKLEVLAAPVCLEAGEDRHWDVEGHVFEHLLPAINGSFKGEYSLHALVD